MYKITQEQADQIVASNNLRDAVQLLGGRVEYKETLNSQGIASKQIIITYNEKKETEGPSQV